MFVKCFTTLKMYIMETSGFKNATYSPVFIATTGTFSYTHLKTLQNSTLALFLL